MRVLSLYLPNWPIDRLRLRRRTSSRRSGGGSPAAPSQAALLLAERRSNAQFVAAASDVALARGVRPGMSLAHARAVAGAVEVHPYDPSGDLAALHALAHWATRFSPCVAVDPPEGLLLDLTGCRRLFGGEGKLVARVTAALGGLGYRVRAAVCDTVGAAWAVSHTTMEEAVIVGEGGQYAAIARLPPWALRIPPETVARLETLGISDIGTLVALPRSTLPSRLGEALLCRLDQALGQRPEPLQAVRPPAEVAARLTFDSPVRSAEWLDAAVQELLAEVVQQLGQRGGGARQLDLTLFPPRGLPVTITVTLCAPSRSSRHLLGLLRGRLERVGVGEGFDVLELAAPEVAPLPHAQNEFFETHSAAARRASVELFDRLAARLGRAAVVAPQAVDAHQPEKAWQARPIREALAPVKVGREVKPVSEGGETGPRPLRLLPRPRAIDVLALSPDGPPSWMRLNGCEHRIGQTAGPERLAAEWWAGESVTRDYYRVCDEAGRWYWVYREVESRRWFLHGVFA